ncbi:MAG: aminotransferase class V-fold PLP-dependent enzyme [Saprospirales bacterium]|nr:aminotransferase class V-fold PLP-dependent enzyme [Saprospirales bacterium]
MQNQRHKFRLPEEVTYLNIAYMSPLLREVEEVGLKSLSKKALPYEIGLDDFFKPVELLKKQFAQLVDIGDHRNVAIIPSVSYGMATVANNIPYRKGGEIVVVDEQFPSNIYIWQKMAARHGLTIRTIPAPKVIPQKGKVWNAQVLEAISDKTILVALPNVHWADGTFFDLAAIREKTQRHDAFLVIDGTQSIGALPFSVSQIKPDAVIAAGYKWLLGPYSLGLAYFGERFEGGDPIEENWINRLGSENFAGLVNYQPQYQEKAARFSVGELSNFIHVPMLSKALEQILDWGVENIQDYCRRIAAPYIDRFRELGCELADDDERCHHLFSIRLPRQIEGLKEKLDAEKIYISIRGDFIRVAPHVFNTENDFDRFYHCLKKAMEK